MKKKYILLVFIIFSCATRKDFQNVKYVGYSNSAKKDYTYKASIKKGFQVKEINGGNEWKQKEFIYSDNSIFYVSNEKENTSRNDENIKNDKIASDKSMKAFFSKDTITLEGIDKNGLYWKNKLDGEVNIGYLNIPKEKKEEFDKILLSIKKK